MTATSLTSRDLLQLRAGARLMVTLRSGRVIAAELTSRPTLSPVGKPGIHRVRLEVLDVDHAAHIAGRGPRCTAFGHDPCARLEALHTVSGASVVSVVSA